MAKIELYLFRTFGFGISHEFMMGSDRTFIEIPFLRIIINRGVKDVQFIKSFNWLTFWWKYKRKEKR